MSRNIDILIVDDDPSVLNFLEGAVASMGHTVHAASSAADALKKLEKLERPVDILLTDVVMPLMSGFELAERFQETNPDSRVIFMSGFSPTTLKMDHPLKELGWFLQKPFTLRELREIIDQKGG